MASNTLKIVFLCVLMVTAIGFITAKKPNPENNVVVDLNDEKITKNLDLHINYFPPYLDIVGAKALKKEELFKKNQKYILVVGNHDSLPVITEFPKYYDVKSLGYEYITVANISNAPWFIKDWVIISKLEEITTGVNEPMIFDDEGYVVNALFINDISKTKYFAYEIDENGSISHLISSDVKDGAMDGSMDENEKKKALEPIYEKINH